MTRCSHSLSLAVLLLGLVAVLTGFARDVAPVAETKRSWYVARRGPPEWRLLGRMAEPVEFSEVRFKVGDDPRWAQPGFDDSNWRVIAHGRPPALPNRAGIMWLRYRVRWNSPAGHLPEGLHFLFFFGSYEVFWDGTLLGRNGAPGNNRAEETEGLVQYNPALPLALTGSGEHLLALRLSSYHATDPDDFSGLLTVVMTPEAFDASFRRDNLFPLMATGALFTLAIAAVVLWLIAARQPSLLLFAGMCLFGGVMEATSWYSMAYVYPVSWIQSLNIVIASAGLALSLCLAAVIMVEWKVPGSAWWLTALLLGSVGWAVKTYPVAYGLAQHYVAASFILVLLCCAWAARRWKHGVWAVGVTVGASGVLLWESPDHFVGLEFFRRFLPTVLGVLLTIALRLRLERRQVQETKLTAARLEIELLKKNLQPHFLMNTLTALAQTVEEEPARAVRLIDDLSQEFRTLSRMASEKTVTLAEELELCRAHLRVMRARTDVDWDLVVDGVEGGPRVPPALFLTLIENGFSHQVARPDDRTFTLRTTALNGRVRYEFLSPGEVTAETTRVAGGTGLRYVRARLEESFPGQWTLTQAAVEGGWETVIDIPGEAAGGTSE